MNPEYKPKGYNSLSPYMVTDDTQRMVELLKGIFGAQELRKYTDEKGGIVHMELKIDDSVLMLADSNENYPANQTLFHVYVPDVHNTFNKAIELGCEAVQKPVNKENDPDTRGMFTDFQGNLWAVSTQLSN